MPLVGSTPSRHKLLIPIQIGRQISSRLTTSAAVSKNRQLNYTTLYILSHLFRICPMHEQDDHETELHSNIAGEKRAPGSNGPLTTEGCPAYQGTSPSIYCSTPQAREARLDSSSPAENTILDRQVHLQPI
jgi:hypothetical protein